MDYGTLQQVDEIKLHCDALIGRYAKRHGDEAKIIMWLANSVKLLVETLEKAGDA